MSIPFGAANPMTILGLLAALCAAPLGGQTATPKPGEKGAMAVWDMQQIAANIKAHTEEFKPLLERVSPKQWSRQESAAAYQPQWEYCRNEIGYLNGSAAKFAQQSDNLPTGLEAYFRLESLNTALRSFIEGIRRDDNPAVAELLAPNLAKLTDDQQALGQYILSLAQQREDQFKAMDREAQRCRATLMRPGAARK